MIDISFIIPVYKTPEPLLRACLASVCSVRAMGIEIICIVDSPGAECERVLAEIAGRDSRIRILRNDINRGAAYSRNRGIDAACGEFISFVDSDDTIVPQVYEEILRVSKERDLSACSCKAEGVRKHCGVEYGGWGFDRGPCIHAFQMGAWAALWRSTCIKSNSIRFPEDLRHNEDFVFVTRFLQLGLPIGFYNKKGYNYINNPKSVTHSAASSRLILDQARSSHYILEALGPVKLSKDDARWYAKRIAWNLFGDWRINRILLDEERRIYVELLSQILPQYQAGLGFALLSLENFLLGRMSKHPKRILSCRFLYYWPFRILMQIKSLLKKED